MRLYNPATGIAGGRKEVATAGTQVQLTTTGTRVRSLSIQAETDNTGLIVVGTTDVDQAVADRNGIALDKGDVLSLDVDDLSKVWIDATVDTDGVTYLYLT